LVSQLVAHTIRALNSVIQSRLFDKRKNTGMPGPAVTKVLCASGIQLNDTARRQHSMDVYIVVQCQSDLLQVVLALCASRSFSSLLHGWQKKCNQDSDDGDHHQ
jgi:hypothetical protein